MIFLNGIFFLNYSTLKNLPKCEPKKYRSRAEIRKITDTKSMFFKLSLYNINEMPLEPFLIKNRRLYFHDLKSHQVKKTKINIAGNSRKSRSSLIKRNTPCKCKAFLKFNLRENKF